MAEVATSVLHNVGNVLNSVNISSSLVAERIRNSELVHLTSAAALMQAEAKDLPGFFTNDPRGRQFPAFLARLPGHLAEEQKGVVAGLASMSRNAHHIKEIVAMQQTYTRIS